MKTLAQLAFVLLVSVATFALAIEVSQAAELRHFHGICPAAATDIPAHPCTREEFIQNSLDSPFAFVGMLCLFVPWTAAWLALWALWRLALALRAYLARKRVQRAFAPLPPP